MPTETLEFAPLGLERAHQPSDWINEAAREQHGLIIDPDEDGVAGSSPVDLISPAENTNALRRFQRHY